MNFNKCSRCGCFFVSNSNICPNCQPKENIDINSLENFIEDNEDKVYNLEGIATSTGISIKNLNRYLSMDKFSDFANKVRENTNNLNINL